MCHPMPRPAIAGLLSHLLVLVVATNVHAACPAWRGGPLLSDAGGADAQISCATTWDPDGAGPAVERLVIAGPFDAVEGVPAPGLAWLDPTSGTWTAIPGAPTNILAMASYNGQLFVAGEFASAGGVAANNIASWDGSAWHALGTGAGNQSGGDAVWALYAWNGLLYVGGLFRNAGPIAANSVASWDGSAWAPLGQGFSGLVYSFGQYDGNLIVGGETGTIDNQNLGYVASWNGSSWSAMGAGLTNDLGNGVLALQVFNGNLYACDAADSPPAMACRIWQWNGATWTPSAFFNGEHVGSFAVYNGYLYACATSTTAVNSVFRYDGALETVGGGVVGFSKQLVVFNGELVDVGSLTLAQGLKIHNIARWDGTAWGSFGGGGDNGVYAMTPFNGALAIGGDLQECPTTGSVAHGIVSDASGKLGSFGTGMDGTVEALKSYFSGVGVNRRNLLVAGGAFVHAGGVTVNNVARWSTSGILYTPPVWTAMGSGFNGSVYALERFGNVVYAGGTFTASGATACSKLAKFNETTGLWEPVGAGLNGPVSALKVFGSYLYAGGQFTTAGGISTGGLARWDGTSWSSVGGYFNGAAMAFEIYGGNLVIGGIIPTFTGSPNLVQFDGTNFSTFGGGTNGYVWALHADGNRLYVGGDMTGVGTLSVNHAAYWDGAWHDMAGGTNGSVLAIGQEANFACVGGTFGYVSGYSIPVYNCVRFDPTGVPPTGINPYSATANAGDNVTFTAVPDTGYTGLLLQWYHAGHALADGPTGTGSTISGAHAENLNLANVGGYDMGDYFMSVTNSCGSDSSTIATLTGATAVEGGLPVTATVFDAVGPNPARGATQVLFSLAREARVTLRVRDVAGRTVRALDLGALAAGRHTALWDARSEDGARAQAGMYFVELGVDGRRVGSHTLSIVR